MLVLLALAGNGTAAVWGLFLAYAGALAFTEGAERALIGDFAPSGQKATAFGLYHMLTGFLALPGGLLFGALWEWAGIAPAFLTAAVLTTLSAAALVLAERLAAEGKAGSIVAIFPDGGEKYLSTPVFASGNVGYAEGI